MRIFPRVRRPEMARDALRQALMKACHRGRPGTKASNDPARILLSVSTRAHLSARSCSKSAMSRAAGSGPKIVSSASSNWRASLNARRSTTVGAMDATNRSVRTSGTGTASANGSLSCATVDTAASRSPGVSPEEPKGTRQDPGFGRGNSGISLGDGNKETTDPESCVLAESRRFALGCVERDRRIESPLQVCREATPLRIVEVDRADHLVPDDSLLFRDHSAVGRGDDDSRSRAMAAAARWPRMVRRRAQTRKSPHGHWAEECLKSNVRFKGEPARVYGEGQTERFV